MSGGAILAVNAGSSSLKLGLFDARAEEQLAAWEVTWAAGDEARDALRPVLAKIDVGTIGAVGHRVVHGGTRVAATVIDTTAREEIAALAALAPLHNPPALQIVAAVGELLPGVPQVAVFDTAFHATLAPEAYLYAVPYDWYERWGVRRFGFHGLSHAYCAGRAAELLKRPLAELRLVTCHLGSGCSLTAIAGGTSRATTMGYTPLDGLVMATRPGAVDPGVLITLLRDERVSLAELEDALYHRSGLLGISGISGHMRDVLAARAGGLARAALAFDSHGTQPERCRSFAHRECRVLRVAEHGTVEDPSQPDAHFRLRRHQREQRDVRAGNADDQSSASCRPSDRHDV